MTGEGPADASALFDERAYLIAFPDVAAAVTAGRITSGQEHYRSAGRAEIAAGLRGCAALLPGAPETSVPVLLALAGRARDGHTRAWDFLDFDDAALVDGFAEVLFERAYLAGCVDLAAALADGTIGSGRAHWVAAGRAEIAEGRREPRSARLAPTPGRDVPDLHDLICAVKDWAPLLLACAREQQPDPAEWRVVELRGSLDQVEHHRLRGWAFDPTEPNAPVVFEILVDGEVVDRVVANSFRPDLVRHGIGDGWHAFEHVFDPPLSHLRHVVAVRREGDWARLARSSVVLPGPRHFDSAARSAVVEVLDTAGTDGELAERIAFLAGQMDRMLKRRSAGAARGAERLRARQFQRRWIEPDAPAEAGPTPRALVIDAVLPQPGHDAGSAAVFSHALSLRRLGYEVLFAAADMGEGCGPVAREALEAGGIAACHAPWFGSVEEVLRMQAHGFDVVYLHRVDVALAYLAMVRRHQPRARVLFSVADLHHLRLARQAEVQERPELLEQAQAVRGQELLVAAGADAVITHSAHEAALLRPLLPDGRVHTIPWSVEPAPGRLPFARRSGFCFVGHYGHAPNLDGALWLADEVMPALLLLDPGIACRLVGTAMPPVLAKARPGVEAVGAVADLSAVLDGVRLSVAPLLFGAGIKGKVLDSLAAGVPCVCTPVAAEGLALGPALRGLVSEGAEAFAAAIHRLHGDKALHAACRREGLDFVARELGTARIDALMAEAARV